jgi:hypothetical protein
MTKVERRLQRRTALGTGAAQYLVRPLADAGEILALLQRRRAYAAYALAQLEPELSPLSEWWIARGTPRRCTRSSVCIRALTRASSRASPNTCRWQVVTSA